MRLYYISIFFSVFCICSIRLPKTHKRGEKKISRFFIIGSTGGILKYAVMKDTP